MTFGIEQIGRAIAGYWNSRFDGEGALWIVMMDGLLLIPLVFAVFFYPVAVLGGVAAVIVFTAILVEAVHVMRTHHLGWRRH